MVDLIPTGSTLYLIERDQWKERALSAESKLEAVRDYAAYRKDYSPCCRDILKLLTGGEPPNG